MSGHEKLMAALKKRPIPAVYGARGWRVESYPSGVRRADIDEAIRTRAAEWSVFGLRLVLDHRE